MSYKTNPTLFEVAWYPFLQAVRQKRLWTKRSSKTAAALWRTWKYSNLPWHLKREVQMLRETRLQLFRRNWRLNAELHRLRHPDPPFDGGPHG